MAVSGKGQRRSLAQAVKDIQRNPVGNSEWWAYCDLHGCGMRDPALHKQEFVERFLADFHAGRRLKGSSRKGAAASPQASATPQHDNPLRTQQGFDHTAELQRPPASAEPGKGTSKKGSKRDGQDEFEMLRFFDAGEVPQQRPLARQQQDLLRDVLARSSRSGLHRSNTSDAHTLPELLTIQENSAYVDDRMSFKFTSDEFSDARHVDAPTAGPTRVHSNDVPPSSSHWKSANPLSPSRALPAYDILARGQRAVPDQMQQQELYARLGESLVPPDVQGSAANPGELNGFLTSLNTMLDRLTAPSSHASGEIRPPLAATHLRHPTENSEMGHLAADHGSISNQRSSQHHLEQALQVYDSNSSSSLHSMPTPSLELWDQRGISPEASELPLPRQYFRS
jgi:hypothetical protein